ncbi:MAG: hypothetical protein CBC48_17990 [bacterium TMED88]|nr:MAG: hypothetical protein CBC48_17990 [bacterium TMED88]
MAQVDARVKGCLYKIINNTIKMKLLILFSLLPLGTAIIRVTEDYIEAECQRFYEPVAPSTICDATINEVWNKQSDSQGIFDGMNDALSLGRSHADKQCEEVCARTNQCRAYAVSSAAHYLANQYECRIYYSCTATTSDTNYNLYVRKLPYNCFITGTSFDGVFSNFGEVQGELAQFQRLLRIATRPFQEVHFTINGVTDTTDYAHRPYKKIAGDFYCDMDEDPLNCVLMNAGAISIIFFFIFIAMLSCNIFLVMSIIK